jgi:DNA repair protein RadD
MIQLRDYQREAVAAVYEHLRTRDDNPCVVIPTGAGKTPCMAQICKDAVGRWDGRVLVLAHVKELLEQTAGTLLAMAPELDVGVYCAGLGSRDTDHAVIVASIQSVYRRAAELGRFDLVLIDEVHMVPADGEGMYRAFLADAAIINPHVRLVGLTATPFRMKTGMICAPENLLNHVCYEVGVKELIVAGYLCPLKTKSTRHKVDTDGLHERAGEFIASETEDLMDTDELVRAACAEIIEYTQERHSCLIFASGIEHGRHIRDVLREEHGVECECVFGETSSRERDEVLARFRGNGQGLFATPLPYLVNMNVLTTGFDAPNIDCIAMLRPTLSPGLYYQLVGRGLRTCSGKEDCLVLDFGGNVLRHGPIDALRLAGQSRGNGEAPAKECPECHSLIACGYRVCPDCGHEFPPPERQKHDPKASTAGILSGQVSFIEYDVEEVCYSVHEKRDAPPDHPKTMRVEYRVGWQQWQSEWICFEHDGWARLKAESWWRERTDWAVPDTARQAVELARQGVLCEALGIKVKRVTGERYDQVVGYRLGPKPLEGCDREGFVLTEEVPF